MRSSGNANEVDLGIVAGNGLTIDGLFFHQLNKAMGYGGRDK